MRNPETVTASEIGSFVYCPESWRLNALGLPAANQPERDAGTTDHAGLEAAERFARDHIAAGRFLLILAALMLLLAAWTVYR